MGQAYTKLDRTYWLVEFLYTKNDYTYLIQWMDETAPLATNKDETAPLAARD